MAIENIPTTLRADTVDNWQTTEFHPRLRELVASYTLDANGNIMQYDQVRIGVNGQVPFEQCPILVLGGGGGGDATILSGSTDPAADLGDPGNAYVNTTSATLFFKLADDTTWIGIGGSGGSGSGVILGTVPPATNIGQDGDVYIDTLNAEIYAKESGAWVLIPFTKGQKGDRGDTGPAGANGNDGRDGAPGAQGAQGRYRVFIYQAEAVGLPAPGTPTGGSYANGVITNIPAGWSVSTPPDTADNYIYRSAAIFDPASGSSALTWMTPVRITGLKGEKGETGDAGANGINGAQGPQGFLKQEIYLQQADSSAPPETPTGGVFDFTTNTLTTVPTNWQTAFPAPATGMTSYQSIATLDPKNQGNPIIWSAPFEVGAAGPTGPAGPKGDPGDPGMNGRDGTNGQPGTPGQDGLDGDNGWTPIFAVVNDNERRVLRLVSYVGGTPGTAPAIDTANNYVGMSGLGSLANGTDIRGPAGSGGGVTPPTPTAPLLTLGFISDNSPSTLPTDTTFAVSNDMDITLTSDQLPSNASSQYAFYAVPTGWRIISIANEGFDVTGGFLDRTVTGFGNVKVSEHLLVANYYSGQTITIRIGRTS